MSEIVTKRCLVSGKVQGVFYRASTRDKANELGISGSAMNRTDGRVEVVASGPAEAVDALCEWLWEGSPASQVDAVECEAYDGVVGDGFEIR